MFRWTLCVVRSSKSHTFIALIQFTKQFIKKIVLDVVFLFPPVRHNETDSINSIVSFCLYSSKECWFIMG